MEEQPIHTILKDALEDEIPAGDVNLWPTVKAGLAAGSYQTPQGKKMMLTKNTPRRLAIAFALLLAVAVVFFATPTGRSFAQSILALFTQAESTSFPLADSQIAPSAPEENAPTALPPVPLISVAEAEAQAGFDIAELAEAPQGYDYQGARLYGDHVSLEYLAMGGGSNLLIQQSREGYYQSEWDSVPAGFVVPVQIGGVTGEFVKGTFVVFAGDTSATWNPDAAIWRLRWEQDGTFFEIIKVGDVGPTEYLDMDGLVGLAESLSAQP